MTNDNRSAPVTLEQLIEELTEGAAYVRNEEDARHLNMLTIHIRHLDSVVGASFKAERERHSQ